VDVIAFVDAVELCELPSRQARQPTGIRDVRQRDLAMAVESEKPFREDSPTSEPVWPRTRQRNWSPNHHGALHRP
jgi:hypothetical protein